MSNFVTDDWLNYTVCFGYQGEAVILLFNLSLLQASHLADRLEATIF